MTELDGPREKTMREAPPPLNTYHLYFTLYFLLNLMRSVDRIGSSFLRRILLRMKSLGVNQSELAKRMKVSKPYITKVLRQDVNFSFRTAAKLAHALEMDFFPELREKV